MREVLPIQDRFWTRVARTETCWLWTGALNQYGYGVLSNGRGRPRPLAHRFAYELLVADIPAGLTIDHLCRVKHCVNPDHMEVVTRAENARRGALDSRPNRPRRTHCKNGHEFTPENTYLRGEDWGNCKTCGRERDRAYRARRSA